MVDLLRFTLLYTFQTLQRDLIILLYFIFLFKQMKSHYHFFFEFLFNFIQKLGSIYLLKLNQQQLKENFPLQVFHSPGQVTFFIFGKSFIII